MAFASIGPTSKSLWTLDPRTIPGCVLWLDANDSNTLVLSGSNVTAWNDKSEFGFNMTASAGAGSLTYSSNGFNGLPTVQFADNGRFSNAMQRYLFNSNITAAVVFQKTGLDSSFTDTVIGRYFSESRPIFAADTSTGNVRIIGNGTGTRTINASGFFSLRTQQPNIYLFQTGSDLSWNEFWNGTQQTLGAATDSGTAAYSDASATFLSIGGFGSAPKRAFNGFVSEVILYNTRLDRYERQRLEGYLANKWNMVYALPSNHPYGSGFLSNIIASPSAIPTCSAWYDAADSTRALVVNGSVNVFLDKVSNFHLTASAAPSITSPTYNGVERYLKFDGAQILNISGGAPLLINTCYTIFVVEGRTATNLTAAQGFNPILGGQGLTTFANFNLTYFSNVNFRHGLQGAGLTVSYPAFNANSEKIQIWVASYDRTNRYLYSNGVLGGSTATTQDLTAWSFPAVGRWSGNTTIAFYNGRIREIIFYKSGLTDTQRQQVEDYLGYKWGLYSNSANLDEFRGSNPLFTRLLIPTDVCGCIGWYDAGDSRTLTLSGGIDVSGWTNKAQSNIENLSKFGSRFPKYSLDASTGYSAVYFDNSDAFMVTDVSSTCVRNTYFAVARVRTVPTTQDTFSTLFSLADAYSGDASVRYRSQDAYWDTSLDYNGNTLWAPQNNGSLYVNGVGPLPPAGRSAPVTKTNIITVLSDVSGTSRLELSISAFGNRGMNDTYVYELLRYNRYLSSNERQKVEGYLAYKWGLTSNLTANHPYSYYYGNKFLPSDIGSLRAWYDAGDSTTLTLSGSTVLRWRDKTGLGFDLSATERFQTYVSNQYVDFNLSGGLFITNASGLVANTSFTIVVAEQLTSSGGLTTVGLNSNYFMGGTGAVTNSNLAFGHRNPTTVRLGFWNNDIDASATAFDPSAEPFNVWTARYDGTQRQIYSNGTLMTTSASTQPLLNWTDAYIGRFPQGTNYYIGRLREILFFRSGLTTSELSNVWSYLAWKWNLQSRLPIAPTISNLVPPNGNPFFTPLAFSNAVLWLDGLDLTTVSLSGTTVTNWRDKSGRRNNAVAGTKASITSGLIKTPTYNASLAGVVFAGDEYLAPGISASVTQETVFAVVRNMGSSGDTSFLGADPITGGRRMEFLFSPSPTRLITVRQNVIEFLITNYTAPAANTTALFTTENNGSNAAGSVRHYQNGTLLGSNAGTITNTYTAGITTYLGAQISGGDSTKVAVFWTGTLHELIIYQSNTLTTQQRQQVEGYLAWKWNFVSSLPSDHPYKLTPP